MEMNHSCSWNFQITCRLRYLDLEYSPHQTRQRCLDYEQTAFDISERSGTITPLDVGISKLRKDPTKKRRTKHYEVECKQFPTFEEAKKFAKATLGRSFNMRRIKEGHFFTNIVRSERRIMSLEYILTNKRYGLNCNPTKQGRLHVCYKDTSDHSTIVWCVCYRNL